MTTSSKPKRESQTNQSIHESIAPLSKGFFLTSIFGFLIAVMFIANYSLAWATIIGILCVVMFLASVISMTKAPVEEELALDEHVKGRDDRVVVMSKKEYEQLKHAQDKK
ncbi:MAG: hypothetical protein ACOCU6_03565 [Nanoarchaeota archaeon]